jgi:polyferredoxin
MPAACTAGDKTVGDEAEDKPFVSVGRTFGMKQSSLRYLGAFDLVLVLAFLLVFGVGALLSGPVIPLMALAGVFALLGGSVAALSLGPVTVTWRHLVGVSYALFAVVLPASYIPDVLDGAASTPEVAMFAVTAIGGLTLLFIGFDIARGGKHFEITEDVDTVVGEF